MIYDGGYGDDDDYNGDDGDDEDHGYDDKEMHWGKL